MECTKFTEEKNANNYIQILIDRGELIHVTHNGSEFVIFHTDTKVKNISPNPMLAADSPPIEDERIFYSVVSDWIGEYGMDTTQLEKSAMEYIRTKIFGKYKLVRR